MSYCPHCGYPMNGCSVCPNWPNHAANKFTVPTDISTNFTYPPAMTDQTLPCREAFEKWAVTKGHSIIKTDVGSWYAYWRTQEAWESWQACWNTRVQSSAPEDSDGSAKQSLALSLCELMRGLEIPASAASGLKPEGFYAIGAAIAAQAKRATSDSESPKAE